jgi:hypothetical protein
MFGPKPNADDVEEEERARPFGFAQGKCAACPEVFRMVRKSMTSA